MDSVLAPPLWLEVGIILLLILTNGFFAMAEIALIAARRTRVVQLAEEGNARAQVVRRLQEDPNRFLATVQVGVTLVGTLAGAVGGASAVHTLQPLLARVPVLAPWSGVLALAVVVMTITYFSLVVGELIPKSLALAHPERTALGVARTVDALSRASRLLVGLLTGSTRAIVRLFGVREVLVTPFVSEEEIKLMVQQGRAQGVFDQTEQELIHSVFEFSEAAVKEVMVPRPKIQAIEIETPVPEVLAFIADAGKSRYPVYRRSLDEVVGILYNRDLLPLLAAGKPVVLADLLHPAYFAPETTRIHRLLREMQRRRMPMALVVDEYGSVEGLVTIEDLVEEIVGEISEEEEEEGPVKRMRDGSLILDASANLRDLQGRYDLDFPESAEYETLAGFLLAQLQRVPRGGEIITHGDWKLTVVDMDGRRINRVRAERVRR
jgi:putative hemolysin